MIDSKTAPKIALEFDGVCFAYEREEVLRNVNLAIAEKSLTAVVGPNGGGKTTFIKLSLGLIKPKCGAINVFGGAPENGCKRIGYVAQHLSFDSEFPVSAMDVVLMGRCERHWLGSYRKEDRQKAMQALERVRLGHLSHRSLAQLSGGERQRVLIAQALVSEPQLLLLDEPTANVDSQVEHEIYDLLHELNEQMTIIIVSHNLSVVTRHATHIACINRTASLAAVNAFSEGEILALNQGDMTVLQHGLECQVLNRAQTNQLNISKEPCL